MLGEQIMGFNADNLFVKCDNRSRVVDALTLSMEQATKWKMAISDVVNGWVQIIDSHESTEVSLTQHLSDRLQCSAILAQLYETTGDIAWYCFNHGQPEETREEESADDPAGELDRFLRTKGIQSQMCLFREALKSGWLMAEGKKRNAQPGH